MTFYLRFIFYLNNDTYVKSFSQMFHMQIGAHAWIRPLVTKRRLWIIRTEKQFGSWNDGSVLAFYFCPGGLMQTSLMFQQLIMAIWENCMFLSMATWAGFNSRHNLIQSILSSARHLRAYCGCDVLIGVAVLLVRRGQEGQTHSANHSWM